uniref:Uncharacterized protein n=1 Tax=Tetranychus urticae TaxID=32264 RepID=T1JSS3_TETUR
MMIVNDDYFLLMQLNYMKSIKLANQKDHLWDGNKVNCNTVPYKGWIGLLDHVYFHRQNTTFRHSWEFVSSYIRETGKEKHSVFHHWNLSSPSSSSIPELLSTNNLVLFQRESLVKKKTPSKLLQYLHTFSCSPA